MAWAHARFDVDPAHLAELLDGAADDWADLADLDDLAPDVDQFAALLDDLPEVDPED